MRLRTPCFCFQTAQKSDALKGAICKAPGSVCGSSNTAATLINKQKRQWLRLEETQKRVRSRIWWRMESVSRPRALLTSEPFNVTVRKGCTDFVLGCIVFLFFTLVDVQTVKQISTTNPNSSIFSDLQDVTSTTPLPYPTWGVWWGGRGGKVGDGGCFPVR